MAYRCCRLVVSSKMNTQTKELHQQAFYYSFSFPTDNRSDLRVLISTCSRMVESFQQQRTVAGANPLALNVRPTFGPLIGKGTFGSPTPTKQAASTSGSPVSSSATANY